MRVRVKRAESAAEKDAVLRLRHRVFAEEEGYVASRPDGILLDRFDVLPETESMIAAVGAEIVGTARLTFDGEVGMPTDAFFDRRGEFPGARLAAGSMLCVRRAFRTPGVVFALMAMTYYRAVDRGATHLLTAGNPEQRHHFERAGFRALGPEAFAAESGLAFVPMALELAALADTFQAFVAKQPAVNVSSLDRVFLASGDTLYESGDPGAAAFVVIDGELRARARIDRTFGPGTVLGESCLLTGGTHTETIEAATDCQLMLVSRSVLEAARAAGSQLRALVELLGVRLGSTPTGFKGFAAGA